MKSYAATDVGRKRKINQDSIFASDKPVGNLPNLYIVADGMGGHNAGDYASRYAVNTVKSYIEESREKNPVKLIDEAIKLANQGIIKEAFEHEEMYGMGTTIVVTTVIGEYAYTANVGDSRLYLYHEELTQITRDHSLVGELVRLGKITEEQALTHPDRNIITRAVGAQEEIEIDFFDYQISPGDFLLMCSDGLSNMVGDAEIEGVLALPDSEEEKTRILINRANENGGKDNIAVLIIGSDTDEV